MPNIFEVLSGGRLIDLGSRLTPEEITAMADCMQKTCPDCGGSGIAGIAMVGEVGVGVIGMMPLACDSCDGTGEMLYFCNT